MSSTKQIPWPRVIAEGAGIVVNIGQRLTNEIDMTLRMLREARQE